MNNTQYEITPFKVGDQVYIPILSDGIFNFRKCIITKVTQDKSKSNYFYHVKNRKGKNYLPIKHGYVFSTITELVDFVFDDKIKVEEMHKIVKNILKQVQLSLF